MATNKGLGLPQQKGTFEIKGVVMGVSKENFYVEKKTKTDKDFRSVNFGITFDKNQTLFVGLTGMPQDNVYFSKRGDKGEKATTEKVAWKDRYIFNKEGFELIGVNCGLKKTDDGKANKIEHLTPFDATKYIGENLKDGMSVYVRGNIEFQSYTNQGGETQHSSKLVVTQISLCKPVDFEEKDFDSTASFQQPLVFIGGRKEGDSALLETLVVNYATVENVDFVIKDEKLAATFKKNLKPYTSLKVWGNIETVKNTEAVEEDSSDSDGWGEKNPLEKLTGQYRKNFVITGADKTTIEKVIYSESEIDKAIETMKANDTAKKDFGEDDNWTGGDNKIEGKKEEDSDDAW